MLILITPQPIIIFSFSFDKMLKKRTVILSFVSSFFLVTSVFYLLNYLSLQTSMEVEKIKATVKHRNNGQKVILFYNKFRYHDRKMFNLNNSKSGSCPFVNCIFTTDKNYLEDITHFEAIVFNRFYYPVEPPKTRSLDQIYIMMSVE